VDTDLNKIIGTGIYKLTKYVNGERAELELNPYYRVRDEDGTKVPGIDKLTILIVPDINTAQLTFMSGKTDVFGTTGDVYGTRGEDYTKMREKAVAGNYSIYDCGPLLGTQYLMFNLNRVAVSPEQQVWFRDTRFRQACAWAIDRKTIINNVYLGLAVNLTGPLSPSNKVFYNPNVKKYEYNLEQAHKLLAEAGFNDYNGDGVIEKPRGVPVKFTLVTNSNNNQRVKMCQIIVQDLKKLGMDVTLSPLQFNNLVAKLQTTFDWEAMVLGLTGTTDPNSGKNVWAVDGRTHHWNQRPMRPSEKEKLAEWQRKVELWETGVFDWEHEIHRLFDEGVQELDEKKRVEIYNKWQEIVAEKLPSIYLVTEMYLPSVRNKYNNLKPTVLGGVFHNLDTELQVIQ